MAAILFLAACSSAAAATEPASTVGANKFDLLLQFEGRASGGDGGPAYRHVTRAMASKAVLDARDAGFGFLRVAVAGYGPSWPDDPTHDDLARWLSDPAAYWRDVDAMFDTLDQANLRLVPSLLWNIKQFPSLTHETMADLITSPNSKSRQLATRYITQFVTRYQTRPTILFYEITNEFNLAADLDNVGRCHEAFGIKQFCAANGDFSSAALTRFSADLVQLIKHLDPTRGVSSGYSAPRPAAAHLARQPEYSPKGADWRPDSRTEFTALMLETNAPFDIVSVHLYAGGDDRRPALAIGKAADMLDIVADIFHPLGKKLFVGEFGGIGPSTIDADVIAATTRHVADYAAIWSWEFYQFNLLPGFDPEGKDFRIEPGHGDEPIRALRPATGAASATPQPARIVLTWPLPCAPLNQPVDIAAVASIGASTPDKVAFFVDGTTVGEAKTVPYQVKFDPRPLGSRQARVEAKAYQGDDVVATASSDVMLNGATGECEIDR